MGAKSKESRGAVTDMPQNGSVPGAHYGDDVDTAETAGNTQPSSPATSEQKQKKKRSGGFLSFLGCCGAPESGDLVDEDKENVHRLEKLPQRQTTSKSRSRTNSEQGASRPGNEKYQPTASSQEQQASGSGSHDDYPTPGPSTDNADNSVDANGSHPASKPTDTKDEGTEAHGTDAEDTAMPDASVEDPQSHQIDDADEEVERTTIPPPPPVPGQAVVPVQAADPDLAVQEPRKWLLPAIAPEHKGRKCLVLDLDETLVHSSFKVCYV